MKGKRKTNITIENLEILDYANEGKAIAKHEGKVIFIAGAMPGDIVDVQLIHNKKDFAEGKILSFKHKSANRVDAICKHFDHCGGCKWQHVPYEEQLKFKQRMTEETLKRIGKIDAEQWLPILGSENQFFYRNKLEFAFAQKAWVPSELMHMHDQLSKPALGYHVPLFWDKVLQIEECFLQPEPSENIRKAVLEFSKENNYEFFDARSQNGLLRNLMIRVARSREVLVLVVFKENDEEKVFALMEYLKVNFPEITSLNYVINGKKNDTIYDLEVKCYSGNKVIYEYLDDLKFQISPQSFFQTNTLQAEKLYRLIKEYADLDENDLVYDLYTGTGSIALYLARYCKKIIGIESVKQAIDDAAVNAKNNNIKNAIFYTADMSDILNSKFIEEHGKPDVVITDPPRVGMHPKVVEVLLQMLPKKIVYVSCNPATQARDLEVLKHQYKVIKSQPLDMFPNTHHLENIVLLTLK
jgi:23S rRNA (uracil1939-C5)-methyltransferase